MLGLLLAPGSSCSFFISGETRLGLRHVDWKLDGYATYLNHNTTVGVRFLDKIKRVLSSLACGLGMSRCSGGDDNDAKQTQ